MLTAVKELRDDGTIPESNASVRGEKSGQVFSESITRWMLSRAVKDVSKKGIHETLLTLGTLVLVHGLR